MFKNLIILAVLAYGAWFAYDNNFLDLEALNSEEATQLAKTYLPNIIEVGAKQVEYLIRSGEKKEIPTLFYVFESSCFLCKWHYSDISYFSKQYGKSQLTILLLSLDSSEMDLARYLIDNAPPTRPLLLKKGEKDMLFNVLRAMGSSYDGSLPHIAVIDKNGVFNDINPGFDPKNKINGFILRSLDKKS